MIKFKFIGHMRQKYKNMCINDRPTVVTGLRQPNGE